MNRTYAEAAAELNLEISWLQDHIKALPHRKFGRQVRFSDTDIAAINDMFAVRPVATIPVPHLSAVRAAARQRAASYPIRRKAA